MKVQFPVEMDDTTRRRLKLALGHRGGMATRSDVRVWLGRILADAVQRLPEAPVKRVKPTPVAAPVIAPAGICANCGASYDEHGKMARLCPPSTTITKGSRFKAA